MAKTSVHRRVVQHVSASSLAVLFLFYGCGGGAPSGFGEPGTSDAAAPDGRGGSSSGGSSSSSSSGGTGSSSGGGSSSNSSSGSSSSSSGGTGSSSGGGSSSNSSSGSSGASSGGGASSSSSSGSSGASSGGVDAGATVGDGGFDPTEVARVAGWLANAGTNGLSTSLNNGTAGPSGASGNINKNFPIGPTRDRLVDSIVGSCAAFAPRLPNWILYCEAVIASAIVSESTYNPAEVVFDNANNDPTVGLLQVRLSSTVHDFNYYGPIPTIAALGCSWPSALQSLASTAASWSSLGGTAPYLAFMEDPACNIPLAAWYYFYNATGNGGPTTASVVYIAQYCQGLGVAGDVLVGLLSHRWGPAGFTRPADPTDPYPSGIKYRFTNILGVLPTPDPFTVPLSPSVTQYCK
jgi:hypothetical protein